jgi:hypothetical protein
MWIFLHKYSTTTPRLNKIHKKNRKKTVARGRFFLLVGGCVFLFVCLFLFQFSLKSPGPSSQATLRKKLLAVCINAAVSVDFSIWFYTIDELKNS